MASGDRIGRTWGSLGRHGDAGNPELYPGFAKRPLPLWLMYDSAHVQQHSRRFWILHLSAWTA